MLVVFGLSCAVAVGAGQQAAEQTVLDGVYTEGQAERGRRAYTEQCSRCHYEDLRGNPEALGLTGTRFIEAWREQSLLSLFDGVSRGGGLRVPKRDLASAPLVLMQKGQLKIAEGLELAPVLKRELLNFKVKINIATGHDSYEAWREGDHDDLVLAVAMACWCGERYLEKLYSLPRPGILADEGVPMNFVGGRRP